jgi:predicted DNA-binding transcriptional regulator
MLALTIVPPKPLSSELNTEGVIDFGFHNGGTNKREAFVYGYFSYIVATKSPSPLIHYTTNNITKCIYKLEQGWIDAGGTHDGHNSAPEHAEDPHF